jgi:hypothetical protein
MKVHDGSASLIVDFDTLHLRCGTHMRPTLGLSLVSIDIQRVSHADA